ncbi:MAG: hypothetical protein IJ558_05340 [Treponema sp.]|nr:hypothetical protein [Treponema sp.]
MLAGHSLGANKVIRYLAETHDSRVDRFLLLSPANVEYLTAQVTDEEKRIVSDMCESGRGSERLPFDLLGWIPCIADTAHFPTAAQNALIFIEGTGHTYQQKEQETAERILATVQMWQKEWE